MSAKFVLDTAAMQEDFFADTALIGIVSSLPIYRFCWLLNQNMGLDFKRVPDFDPVLQTNSAEIYFSFYQYCMPANGNKYSIYKLKSGNEILLPEVKHLDFIWLIESVNPSADALKYVEHLRHMPDIQLAQILDTERLKNLNNLLV